MSYETKRAEIVKQFDVTHAEADQLLNMDFEESVTLRNGKEAYTGVKPLSCEPDEYYVPVFIGNRQVCVNYQYHD